MDKEEIHNVCYCEERNVIKTDESDRTLCAEQQMGTKFCSANHIPPKNDRNGNRSMNTRRC
jgi:hypothetical protein